MLVNDSNTSGGMTMMQCGRSRSSGDAKGERARDELQQHRGPAAMTRSTMTATITYLKCCWWQDLHSWSASWTCFDPFELQETASSLKLCDAIAVPELPMTLRLQAQVQVPCSDGFW